MQTIKAWSGLQRKRLSRRSALGGLALAGAGVAAFAAACKGPKAGGRPSGSTSTNQPGKPTYGGQLNLGAKQDPNNFDPAPETKATALYLGLTNDGLLGFKTGPDVPYDDVSVVPRLAERWETPDAQTYTFHLQNGVKFADLPPVNGRALSAADVKWSYEYLSRSGALSNLPPTPSKSLFEGLEQIETPDPATVVVRFAQPFAPFSHYAASEYCAILAHEVFEQDGGFSKRQVGSGPWQLDLAGTRHGERWVFKKNPAYFAAGRPYIDQVNYLVIPDDAANNSAFLANQLDILDYSGMTIDTAEQIRKAAASAVQSEHADPSGGRIYLNVARPPLTDARIRKAIALSINRDAFIKAFAKGDGEWALEGSRPRLFTQEETKQILKYDPAQAKQLVGQAGFANGVELDCPFPGTQYGAQFVSELQLLQAQLKASGINLRLRSVDQATASKARRTGDYQLTTTPAGGFAANMDLDSVLFGLFDPKSASNFGKVNDPDLTVLLEAQRRELDPAKRTALIKQAVHRINETPWGLALFYGKVYNFWHPAVKNYAPNVAVLGEPLINAWVAKQ